MKGTYFKTTNTIHIRHFLYTQIVECTGSCNWENGTIVRKGIDFEIETLEEAHYPDRLMAYPLNNLNFNK